MTLSIRSAAVIATAVFAVFAAPHAAGEPTDSHATTTVSVQVADLNLANPDGVDALYQRLTAATRQVCGNTSDLKIVGSLKQLRLNKACFDITMAQALAEANFASVAQLNAN